MLAVTKFGGSSLSNATQFSKVKNIVLSDPKRQIVVCSALGKRDKSKQTDSKLHCIYNRLTLNHLSAGLFLCPENHIDRRVKNIHL